MLGTRDGHVESAQVSQEAETRRHWSIDKVVGSDTVEDYDVLFLALVGVNTVYVYVLLLAVEQVHVIFKLGSQESHLTLVRSDKTDPLLQSLQALVTTELDKCLDELESKVRLDNVHSRQI